MDHLHSFIPRIRATFAGLALVGLAAWSTLALGKPIGIVITKKSTAHPDGTAVAFEFKQVRRQREVTTYILPSGKGLRLTMFDPQTVVFYPDLTRNQITTDEQIALLRKQANRFEETMETYPKSAPILQPHLVRVEQIIARYTAGEVFVEGAFMQREDFDKLLREMERIAEQRRLAELEKNGSGKNGTGDC